MGMKKLPKKKSVEGTPDKALKVLAKEFREAKDEKERLKAELKVVNVTLEGGVVGGDYQPGLDTRIAEAMKDAGMDKFSMPGVGTVFLKESSKPTVEDADAMKAWLREEGHEGIIKETVAYMSLLGLCNELKEQFKSLPDGVKTTDRTVAQLRRK